MHMRTSIVSVVVDDCCAQEVLQKGLQHQEVAWRETLQTAILYQTPKVSRGLETSTAVTFTQTSHHTKTLRVCLTDRTSKPEPPPLDHCHVFVLYTCWNYDKTRQVKGNTAAVA